MAQLWPTTGQNKGLDRIIQKDTIKCHLFKNNVTVALTDTLATYTEADFTGYAAVNTSGWTAAAQVGGVASATAAAITFTVGAPLVTGNNIYGGYLTDAAGNLLAAWNDAAAPINMNAVGFQYVVTPTLTLNEA